MRSAQDRDREQEQKIGVLEGRTEELKSSAESLQRECEELRAALKEKEVTRAAANSRVEMLSAELSTKVSGGGWSAKDERWIEEECVSFIFKAVEQEMAVLCTFLGAALVKQFHTCCILAAMKDVAAEPLFGILQITQNLQYANHLMVLRYLHL